MVFGSVQRIKAVILRFNLCTLRNRKSDLLKDAADFLPHLGQRMQTPRFRIWRRQGGIDWRAKPLGNFCCFDRLQSDVINGLYLLLCLVDELAKGRPIFLGDLTHAFHHFGQGTVGPRNPCLEGFEIGTVRNGANIGIGRIYNLFKFLFHSAWLRDMF